MKIFSISYIEVQDITGAHVNKVYQHKPVALDPELLSVSPSSTTSDNSSLSVRKLNSILRGVVGRKLRRKSQLTELDKLAQS